MPRLEKPAPVPEESLRALFAGQERPRLSPDFEARLRQRLAVEGLAVEDHAVEGLAAEAAPAPRRRPRLNLLALYWLAAAALSLWIAMSLPWPAELSWPLLAGGAALALTLCGPALVLSRRFGLDLFELIFLSAETPLLRGTPARPRA